MVGEGHSPTLQLDCCLPTETSTELPATQVKYRQWIANAGRADGRQSNPFPETSPIKSNEESCKKDKQDGYYSGWYTCKHCFLLFQLFLLDPCTGSILLAELCCL